MTIEEAQKWELALNTSASWICMAVKVKEDFLSVLWTQSIDTTSLRSVCNSVSELNIILRKLQDQEDLSSTWISQTITSLLNVYDNIQRQWKWEIIEKTLDKKVLL